MMKVFEIAKITLKNTAHGESEDGIRWWWHILADFLVKVSKFCRSNGFFIWNLQSWGECATINVLHLDLLS